MPRPVAPEATAIVLPPPGISVQNSNTSAERTRFSVWGTRGFCRRRKGDGVTVRGGRQVLRRADQNSGTPPDSVFHHHYHLPRPPRPSATRIPLFTLPITQLYILYHGYSDRRVQCHPARCKPQPLAATSCRTRRSGRACPGRERGEYGPRKRIHRPSPTLPPSPSSAPVQRVHYAAP
ncbi:hypothetical protein FKP32DRAFT_1762033 [Trametes sanguinea]|nr:hypothetical protein FKP32DRAFT_1762033 [Trametes sanguinea]